jgi:hypothetical protein
MVAEWDRSTYEKRKHNGKKLPCTPFLVLIYSFDSSFKRIDSLDCVFGILRSKRDLTSRAGGCQFNFASHLCNEGRLLLNVKVSAAINAYIHKKNDDSEATGDSKNDGDSEDDEVHTN